MTAERRIVGARALILCALLAGAPKGDAIQQGRLEWKTGTGGSALVWNGASILDVSPVGAPPSAPWKVGEGALNFSQRIQTDTFAIHAMSLAPGDRVYEADLEIVDGNVAGIVFQAESTGNPCFGVLLDAGSKALRIVYLPWPGADLHMAPAPVERGRIHRLRADVSRRENSTRFEVTLDGRAVTAYTDSRYHPTGRHFGVMANSSRSRFDRIAVYERMADGEAGRLLLEDGFDRDTAPDFGQSALPFAARLEGDSLLFEARFPDSGHGFGAIGQITHRIESPRHVWIPHVSPYEDTVIGDHSFRSPAVLLADAKRAIALIPDLDDVRAAHASGLQVWVDYDHPARRIRVAAGRYRVGRFHVAYQPAPVPYAGQTVRLRLHVLVSQRRADLENPYGMAARWLWNRWGRTGYEAGGSQRAPLASYAAHVVNWAFAPEPQGWGDTVWQRFTIEGKECGAPAFIVDVAQHPSVPVENRRWREQRSVWNQAWFSTQRTANGLLRYARQTGSVDLEQRARLMTRVALSAPQTDGLFPSVYTAGGGGYSLYKDSPGWEKGRWTNSDRRPPGVSEKAVHILDAAFTARLLLEWHELNPSDTEAREYAARFAERLLRLQRADGSFPGWVEPDGSEPPALGAGPESAMSATLLLEIARRYPHRRDYRRSAERALAYLENGPVREGRWEDFETYFSCSRWGGDQIGRRIARNGVFKSNTFSPFWCAEAFLAASRVLRKPRFLSIGRRCLDELSLYQQVWEPPWIPAPTHGGFGVMNADGEWNDARQSLFAPLYLEYYRETGVPEYFERGVSALRASFAMMYCPENAQVKTAYENRHPFFGPESYGFMMENIAHGGPGPDAIGPFTIFTWGNGAALEAAVKVRDRFGDLFVDIRRGRAFGIDGCNAKIQAGRLMIRDPYRRNQLTGITSSGRRLPVTLTAGLGEIALPRE